MDKCCKYCKKECDKIYQDFIQDRDWQSCDIFLEDKDLYNECDCHKQDDK